MITSIDLHEVTKVTIQTKEYDGFKVLAFVFQGTDPSVFELNCFYNESVEMVTLPVRPRPPKEPEL